MPSHNQASGHHEEREYGWERGSRVWYNDDYGWQTVDSFAKLKNNAFGVKQWDALNDFVQPVKDLIGDVAEQPIVQQVVETVAPPIIKAYGGIRYSPGPIKTFTDNLEGAKEFLDDKLNTAGIDTRFGDFSVALAEEATGVVGGKLLKGLSKLSTLGPPRTRQLAIAKGGAHVQIPADVTPDLSQQVLNLTTENFVVPGVKQGISTTGKYAKALDKWKSRREYLLGELQNPNKQTAKAQKVERSKIHNDLSTFNPDEEQLGFWGKGPTTKYLKMVKEQGAVPGQQAHHLFPKNESYAFVKRMVEVGDDDDLVNMFLYAEMLDAHMGGRLKNMMMMDVQPHIGKATTINGRKLEDGLHLQRQRDGREFKHKAAENMEAFADEAQTADELMAKFDDYIRNNVIQSKADAFRLQREFDIASKQVKEEFTQLIPTLSEAQRRRL